MKLTILTDRASWLLSYWIPHLRDALAEMDHSSGLIERHEHCPGGDMLFVLGYQHIVPANIRHKYAHTLIVHGSALPQGRGWSPWAWQVLAGKNRLTMTLFEAVDAVDAGPIYAQQQIVLNGHELLDEIHREIGGATVCLLREFVRDYPMALTLARRQEGQHSTYRRRTPADSELDTEEKLSDLFPLLRIVDNQHYPAFFKMFGHEYELQIRKRA